MLDILQNRRSIRKFKAQVVEPEKVDMLTEAILRSPSSRGLNPWEFIIVTERDKLQALSQAKTHGSEFLAGAALAFVIAADPERCDVWVEDCAIAAITLQLMAVSLGLGSCWSQIRLRPHGDGQSAETYVREIVKLPERFVVDCIVGIGYPQEDKRGHSRDSLPFHKVHHESFGSE
jgi:nitroreductase